MTLGRKRSTSPDRHWYTDTTASSRWTRARPRRDDGWTAQGAPARTSHRPRELSPPLHTQRPHPALPHRMEHGRSLLQNRICVRLQDGTENTNSSTKTKAAGCGEEPSASPRPTAAITASDPAGPQGTAWFPGGPLPFSTPIASPPATCRLRSCWSCLLTRVFPSAQIQAELRTTTTVTGGKHPILATRSF